MIVADPHKLIEFPHLLTLPINPRHPAILNCSFIPFPTIVQIFKKNPFILCLCIPLLSVAVCILVISFWVAPYQLTFALNSANLFAHLLGQSCKKHSATL